MRKLLVAVGVVAAISSATAWSALANPAPPVGTALAAAVSFLDETKPIGCYRLGLTGYHWYRSCIGPHWLYPHHRACRHDWCGYR
jgi:hypothetical protein